MSASLEAYRHARVIVQNARTRVADAALAMKVNEVGCVLVTNGEEVIGIVTDRDIALRVVGAGRSPRDTELGAVMSSPVLTLDASASPAAAIRLMRERKVRRVPIVERKRVVGVVTLDDLILERAATLDEITDIVSAQVIHPGPARTRPFDEWTSLARRHGRAAGTKVKLLDDIKRRAHLSSRRHAELAAETVLEVLVRSVDDTLGAELIARLPVAFRGRLRDLSTAGDDRAVQSRAQCEKRISRALEIDRATAATVVDAVGVALSRFVRASDPIGRRLPTELRAILGGQSRRTPKPRLASVGSGMLE